MTENWLEKRRLHDAASEGNLEIVRRLIATGADVNAFDEDSFLTPLHYAAKAEHQEVAKFLLESGANVNAHYEPRICETPLGEIASNCSYEMAKLLIDAGANPTIRGWMQLSAIDRASERKKTEGAKVYGLLMSEARKRYHWK